MHLQCEIPSADHHRNLISCQVACPVHTDARGYVRAIAEGNYEKAYWIARGPNPFASICGRVCGAPCESACRRGKIPVTDADGHFVTMDRPVSIRALKRFACERFGVEAQPALKVLQEAQNWVPQVACDAEEMAALLRSSMDGKFERANGESIAIVGAGPAGLAASHDLALMGFKPIVFETEAKPAGMLMYGIPEYRLPRDLILREVGVIEALGVEYRCSTTVGKDVSFQALCENHAAVIIAVGAKSPRMLSIPGVSGPGVYGGVDFLRMVVQGETLPLGKNIVVIGGGNVAYDVARTVLRQVTYDIARSAARMPGAPKVRILSLETLEEMPADTLEIREGDEEGILRFGGFGPVQVLRNESGQVVGLEVQRCLRVYDENKRFAPVFDAGDKEVIECDTIMVATGQAPDVSFLENSVEMLRPGWPKVDANTLSASIPGIFIAGDLAHGTRLMIDAIASGKKAARSVYQHVTRRKIHAEATTVFQPMHRYFREHGYEKIRRIEVPTLAAEKRLENPKALVEEGYDEAQAKQEASRCLDCSVTPVFDGTRCVLCGGCADVCPTSCLKLVSLSSLEGGSCLDRVVEDCLGSNVDRDLHSAILKDEDRCIRCALCVHRCPNDAISMERVTFDVQWRNS